MTAWMRPDYWQLATDNCISRLLCHRCCRAINIFENPGCATSQQGVSNSFAERNRVAAALLLAQNFRAIRTGNNRGKLQPAILHLSERANRDLASAAQLVQYCALAGGSGVGRRVVEKREMFAHLNIAFADLDAKRTLSCRGAHKLFRKDFLHQFHFAQPCKSGGSQNDGIVFAFFQLAHARVNIAPQRMDHQIGPRRLQLRLAAQATGTHARTMWQRLDAVVLDGQKHVARIDPRGDGNHFESGRQLGRQVFEAVHSEINPAFGQGVFDLLGEHAFGADLGQCYLRDLVAGGLDDLELDLVAALAQQCRNVIGLPESELRSAGTNPKARHQFRAPGFPLLIVVASSSAAFLASRNPKSLRTRSITVVASDDSRAALLRVVMGVCMILLIIPRDSASTASSCSGVRVPSRPRTRSISAWRTVSRCSCKETMVGTTSSVCSRDSNLSTSSCTMASARSAAVLRSAMCDDTTCCRSSMS